MSTLSQKSVSDSTHGLEQFVTELLSKLKDVRVHRPSCRKALIAPDPIQQLFSRKNSARILTEEPEQIELHLGQTHELTAVSGLACSEMELDPGDDEPLLRGPRRGR